MREEDQPSEEDTEQEQWNYLCVGIGKTFESAHENWIEDCKSWSKYSDEFIEGYSSADC
jgi:hypothetical protein